MCDMFLHSSGSHEGALNCLPLDCLPACCTIGPPACVHASFEPGGLAPAGYTSSGPLPQMCAPPSQQQGPPGGFGGGRPPQPAAAASQPLAFDEVHPDTNLTPASRPSAFRHRPVLRVATGCVGGVKQPAECGVHLLPLPDLWTDSLTCGQTLTGGQCLVGAETCPPLHATGPAARLQRWHVGHAAAAAHGRFPRIGPWANSRLPARPAAVRTRAQKTVLSDSKEAKVAHTNRKLGTTTIRILLPAPFLACARSAPELVERCCISGGP